MTEPIPYRSPRTQTATQPVSIPYVSRLAPQPTELVPYQRLPPRLSPASPYIRFVLSGLAEPLNHTQATEAILALLALNTPLLLEHAVDLEAAELGVIAHVSDQQAVLRALRGALPTADITIPEEFACPPRGVHYYSCTIGQGNRPDIAPLKDVSDFVASDPANAILEAIFPLLSDESVKIHYLIRIPDPARLQQAYKDLTVPAPPFNLAQLLATLFGNGHRMPTFQSPLQRQLEDRLLFPVEVTIKISLIGRNINRLKSRARSLFSVFASRFTTIADGLYLDSWHFSPPEPLPKIRPLQRKPGLLLSIGECAALWHPFSNAVFTPGVSFAKNLPVNLPQALLSNRSGILLGYCNFRGEQTPIFLPDQDLHTGHAAIPTGETGMGKSVQLEYITGQLISKPDHPTLLAIDPHARYGLSFIGRSIPEDRLDDVILWEVGDKSSTLGFSPFELPANVDEDDLTQSVFSSLRQVFKEGWSSSTMERVFYAICATLVALPNGGTLLDAPRLFSEPPFRRRAVGHLDDPTALQFWFDYEELSRSEKRQWVQPVLTRLSRFTGSRQVRIATCQRRGLNFGQLIRQGKILVITITGQSVSGFADILTELITSRITIEVLGRLSEPFANHRRVYIVIDESSYVRGPSLPKLISEGRKARATVLLVNQHLSRWSQELQESVLSNVGTLLFFQTGVKDARELSPIVNPFTVEHLVKLDNRECLVKMKQHGKTMPVFPITTPEVTKQPNHNIIERVRRHTKEVYGRPLEEVERDINPFFHSPTSSQRVEDVDEE